MKNKSVTLLELIVVVIIIGILSTLGLGQYFVFRENAFDREAQGNLRLILAAERIARMESIASPPRYVLPVPNTTAGINSTLHLILPVTNAAWNYTIVLGGGGTSFCAQATRATGTVRRWHIHSPTALTPDPQPQAGICH